MKSLRKMIATGIVLAILALAVAGSVALSGENAVREEGLWSDATDVLSSTAASNVGREGRPPLINTEAGNRLVFFFALGGLGAGFGIGYYWRRLLAESPGAEYSGKSPAMTAAAGAVAAAGFLAVAGLTAFPDEPKIPFLDPALGDLLLFVFAFSGAVGGFTTGYAWRRLVAMRRKEAKAG